MSQVDILMYLLSKLTRFVWRVGNLVIEHGEIKRETETNGMRRLHLLLGNVKGSLVGILRLTDHD